MPLAPESQRARVTTRNLLSSIFTDVPAIPGFSLHGDAALQPELPRSPFSMRGSSSPVASAATNADGREPRRAVPDRQAIDSGDSSSDSMSEDGESGEFDDLDDVVSDTHAPGNAAVLADFKDYLRSDAALPEQRAVWDSIFGVADVGGADWNEDHNYRPYASPFQHTLVLLFTFLNLSKRKWEALRDWLLWIHAAGYLVGVPVGQINTYDTMQRLQRYMPTLPDPEVKDCSWRPAMPRQAGRKRQRGAARRAAPTWSATSVSGMEEASSAMTASDDDDAASDDSEASEKAKSSAPDGRICRSLPFASLTAMLSMTLAIPNALLFVDHGERAVRSDSLLGGNDCVVDCMTDTPFVRRFECWTEGKFVVTNNGAGNIVVQKGRMYRKAGVESLIYICGMEWKQHKRWRTARAAGCTTSTANFEQTVHNRRPVVEIEYVLISAENDTEFSVSWNSFSFLFGESEKRTVAFRNLFGHEAFVGWDEILDDFDFEFLRYEKQDGELRELTERERAEWSEIYRRVDQRPRALREADAIPVFLTMGWDAFNAHAFSARASKPCGFYAQIANHSWLPFPWLTLAVTQGDVPYHVALQHIWREIGELRKGVKTLVAHAGEDGELTWQTRNVYTEVFGVALDKENLDNWQLSVRSHAQNRTEGSFYRGYYDNLILEDDFTTLDGRYLQNMEFLRRTRRQVLGAVRNKGARDRIRRAEGWHKNNNVDRWLPRKFPVNSVTNGIVDVFHTFERIWLLTRNECIRVLRASNPDYVRCMRSFLEQWRVFNQHIPAHKDELGLKYTEKTDFLRSYRRSLIYTIVLGAVAKSNPLVALLRQSLHLFVKMCQTRRESVLLETQRCTRQFLENVERMLPQCERNLDIPKMRALISLGWVVLPLYYNTTIFAGLGVEGCHQAPKEAIQRRSNNLVPNLGEVFKRSDVLWGFDYMWNGGRCGKDMQHTLSATFCDLRKAQDSTKPLFDWKSVSGVRRRMPVRARVHGTFLQTITTENVVNIEWVFTDPWRLALERWLSEHGLTDDDWTVEKGFVRGSDVFVRNIRSVLISDRQNSTHFTIKNNDRNAKAQIFCIDTENEFPFMLQIAAGVDCFISGEGWDGPEQFQLFLGKVWRLRWSEEDSVKVWDLTNRARYTWWFDSEDIEVGGDGLGLAWVPGCCLRRPGVSVHHCVPRGSEVDGEGCGLYRNGWNCDTRISSTFDFYCSEFIWCPKFWQKMKAARIVEVPNVGFSLDNLRRLREEKMTSVSDDSQSSG